MKGNSHSSNDFGHHWFFGLKLFLYNHLTWGHFYNLYFIRLLTFLTLWIVFCSFLSRKGWWNVMEKIVHKGIPSAYVGTDLYIWGTGRFFRNMNWNPSRLCSFLYYIQLCGRLDNGHYLSTLKWRANQYRT